MLTKKLLIPFISGIAIVTVATAGIAFAQTPAVSGLAQAIAQKFNLNPTEVQTVITQYQQTQKQQMHQEMQQKVKSYLDSKVKDGTITQAQENVLIAELQKVQTEYSPESWSNLTPDQRQQQMQKMKQELQSWAQSQGIDLSKVLPQGMNMMGVAGMGMMKYHMPRSSVTPTP